MNEIDCCNVRVRGLSLSPFIYLDTKEVTHLNREQKHVFIFQLLLLLR